MADAQDIQIGKLKMGVGDIVRVVIWIITVTLAYGALSERISVLETRYDNLFSQLQRIDGKLDRILERRP
jgi:hypothetical protein